MEKLHLRGLLCGNSPAEIAEKLDKNSKGVETDLCTTLYRYVKSLLGKCDEKIDNWRRITEWLEEAGYKNQSTNNSLFDKNAVNITHITFENNQIKIGVYLQITFPVPPDITIQGLDENLTDEMN